MRNRLILSMLLCAMGAAAQIPSITTNSKLRFTEGNTIFDRTVGDIFSTIDVDLVSGITGTLPVGNGGTGATSFTANRVLLGNGSSAITTSGNLTFASNLLTIGGFSMSAGLAMNGALTISPGGVSISSNSNLMAVTFSPTMTANSLTVNGLNLAYTPANNGTRTGQNYASGKFTSTTSSTTSADVSEALNLSNTNSSPNISQMYIFRGTLTENATSGTLTTRTGSRMDINKGSNALDSGTGTGIQATVQDNTATGRWNLGFGIVANVINAITSRGINSTITTSKGTGNTQYGIDIANNVSGSGVVVDNAYGINLSSTASSSGIINNYYGLYQSSIPSGATSTYFLYNGQSGAHSYSAGGLSLGVNSTGARATIRGAGATSGTTGLLVENSSGTDALVVRDDGASSFGGSPASSVRLTCEATSADSTTYALDAKRSSTSVLKVRSDGRVSVNNAAFQDALTVNGKVRADGLVLTNQTAVTSSGQLIYNNGSGGTYSGYLTLGDGSRQQAILPAMIQRQVIDYNVSWTTGRTKAFWTVPARFNGWKIGKAYIEVSSIGSGAGDDEVAVEIGGVAAHSQIITSGTHTLVMNEAIATDDIVTFNVTQISATPAKGLNISLELIKN